MIWKIPCKQHQEVLFGVVPVIGFNPQRIILPIGLKFVLAAFTRHYLSVYGSCNTGWSERKWAFPPKIRHEATDKMFHTFLKRFQLYIAKSLGFENTRVVNCRRKNPHCK